KPHGKVLGPKLGGDVQKVMKAARDGDWSPGADGTVVVAGITLEEGELELGLDPAEGAASAALHDNDAVAALDIDLTPELRAEGLARDLVRIVQQARKDADLAVTDRISLMVDLPEGEVGDAVRPWLDFVAGEVLATSITEGPTGAPAPGASSEGTLD